MCRLILNLFHLKLFSICHFLHLTHGFVVSDVEHMEHAEQLLATPLPVGHNYWNYDIFSFASVGAPVRAPLRLAGRRCEDDNDAFDKFAKNYVRFP